MKVTKVVWVVFTVLVLSGFAVVQWGVSLVDRMNNNLTVVDMPTRDARTVVAPSPATTPEGLGSDTESFTMLILGSDTRNFTGSGKYGNATNAGIEGERSDTTLLVHVYPGREAATAVSIPRDSMVNIPECERGGETYPATTSRFNEAFARGGVQCTVLTVETLTGLTIDHFAVLNFNAFKDVVNAVGGVEVCLPEAINDPNAQLSLPAGKQTLKGENALGYVRVRETVGDGSDLQRIARQQAFLASLAKETLNAETLTNPVTVYKLLDGTTKNLTISKTLGNVPSLVEFATSLRHLTPSSVSFVTVPVVPNNDGATVSWNTREANQIWEAFADNTPYPKPATRPEGQKALTVTPNAITIRVETSASNQRKASARLRRAGYNTVTATSRELPAAATPTVMYPPAMKEAARTVQWSLRQPVTMRETRTAPPGVVTLLLPSLSPDFQPRKDQPVVVEQRKSVTDTTPLTVEQDLCPATR